MCEIYIDTKGNEVNLDMLVFEIESSDSYGLGTSIPTKLDLESLEDSYVNTNFTGTISDTIVSILSLEPTEEDVHGFNYEMHDDRSGKEGVSYRNGSRNYI